jgi:hypothetical protein
MEGGALFDGNPQMTLGTPVIELIKPSGQPGKHGALETRSARRRIYAVIVGLLFAMAWITQAAKSHKDHEALDFVVSDAEGYWVYLPSLVLDGNLNFTRQIYWHAAVHPIDAAAFPQTRYGMRNHWPTGIALTLAPAFLLAHGIALSLHPFIASPLFAPNGYSLVYQTACLCVVMLLGWLTLVAADDVMERHFKLPGPAIAAAVVVYAVGSSWAYYIFREPFMSHGIGAAWIMFTIWLADRIASEASDGRVGLWQWPLLCFTLSMGIICRPTNISAGIIALWPLIVTVRAGLLRPALRRLPLMIVAAFPLVVQCIILRILSPRNTISGAGASGYAADQSFHWLHPAMVQTLFSSNHGLFFWSPVLLLAVWGYARQLRSKSQPRDGLVISLVLTFALLWYVNSSWFAWFFGKSFGARSFVDLSGVFIIGLGLGFNALRSISAGGRRAVFVGLGFGLLVNWTLLVLFITNRIPRQAPLWGADKVYDHADDAPPLLPRQRGI